MSGVSVSNARKSRPFVYLIALQSDKSSEGEAPVSDLGNLRLLRALEAGGSRGE